MLLFAWVLRGVEYLLLLFAWVFRWYLLKPMQIPANPYTQVLKPMRIAAKESQKITKIDQKCLKPMRIAAKVAQKTPAGERRISPLAGPALRSISLTHPHSFASPARTNESKSKSISRLQGADKPNSLPQTSDLDNMVQPGSFKVICVKSI